MSQEAKPVVRVGLRRIDAATLVEGEPLLARCELLRAVGGSLAELLEVTGVRRYLRGSTVYDPGDATESIYLVAAGEVAILTGPSAAANHVATLHPGDLFGAGAALDRPHRRVTARASTDVDLLELPADRVRRLVADHPEVRQVVEAAHTRLADAAQELDDFLDRW